MHDNFISTYIVKYTEGREHNYKENLSLSIIIVKEGMFTMNNSRYYSMKAQ